MNEKIFSILRSPDDGTPIGPDLASEGGIQYEMTDSGILLLCLNQTRVSDDVYESSPFRKWNSILEERIQYYTKPSSCAGLLANWAYRSIGKFNERSQGEWLIDLGCGDGAHVSLVRERTTYIGIDRNLDRLEILKKNYPEVVAIYGDAASLPFSTGSIQNVFSSFAFEHLWYLKDAVMELHRCTIDDSQIIIVFPTEGGLWNLGRRIFSKPFFQKKYPDIDFNFINRVEHCNQANQVIRTLETFFDCRKKYSPTRIPTIYANAFIEVECKKREISFLP